MLNIQKQKIKHAHGFTLLEVMIGLIIFSIGLLGLAGLQSQSLNFNHSASLRSTGTYIAYDIIDRMRNNRPEVLAGNYNIALDTTPSAPSTTCDAAGDNCSQSQLRLADLYQWKQAISSRLPYGKGAIATTISGTSVSVTVNLQWVDSLSSTGTSNISIDSEL